MSNDVNAALLSKVDTLIRLQAAIAVAHYPTQKDKILFLNGAGLGPSAIAGIIGSTPNAVSVAISNAGKDKKSEKAKGGKVSGSER